MAALALVLSGCGAGLIYTHTVEPPDLNQRRTQAVQSGGQGDIRHIQYYVSVTWNSNGIGEIAPKNGIKTIYYADLEQISILGGLWRQFIVHVYGE